METKLPAPNSWQGRHVSCWGISESTDSMDASSTPPNHPANPNQPSKIIQTSNYSHHLIKIREKEQVQLQLFNSSKKPSKNPQAQPQPSHPPLATSSCHPTQRVRSCRSAASAAENDARLSWWKIRSASNRRSGCILSGWSFYGEFHG